MLTVMSTIPEDEVDFIPLSAPEPIAAFAIYPCFQAYIAGSVLVEGRPSLRYVTPPWEKVSFRGVYSADKKFRTLTYLTYLAERQTEA